jgi:CubicO group peptidase (beta-lactamase class C family)
MRASALSTLLIGAAVTLVGIGGAPAAADGAPVQELTQPEVQEFLDTRVPRLLDEQDVPGAAVSVVAGGEEIFAGGYGYADLENEEPVVADRTAFPVSSVGKTFTAMAVLQLVDDSQLDLDSDVNDYLSGDIQIADTHPGQPVTAHHLLSHTAGFEETIEGMAAADADSVLPLAHYVRERQPERIYPPGQFVGYSNYGYSLAGLLVENISGQPFAERVEERVFAPLGMTDTAFAQPDEAERRFETPELYTVDDGVTPAWEEYSNSVPAGVAVATVTDMSRLMLALLNGGELDGERVLAPERVAAMMDRQHTSAPRLAGTGYGMYEFPSNGPRLVGHDGDAPGTHARYTLVPEHDTGIYVVVNGDGNLDDLAQSQVRDAVVEEFLAEFFDIEAVPDHSDQVEPAQTPLADYAGTYRITRFAHNDPSALVYAVIGHTRVSVTDDGSLLAAPPGMPEQEWIPDGGGLFRAADGSDLLAFLEEDGEITGMSFGSEASMDHERIAWYQEPVPLLVSAGVALLVLASMLAWPVAALIRRRKGGIRPELRGAPRYARLLAGTTGAVCVGYLLVLLLLLSDWTLLEQMMLVGSPVFTAPLTVAAVLSAGVVAAAALAWWRRWWRPFARVHFTAVALALVSFLAVGYHYNLMWTPLSL